MQYTGATAYRATVKFSEARQIPGLPQATIFWYGTRGQWVYTTPLDENIWEITCRVLEPSDEHRSTWGQEVDFEIFRSKLVEYCEPIQQLIKLAHNVKRFDYFAGDRLPTIVKGGSITLLGDASHPLSGAFGAGAGFALEDAHALAGSLRWMAETDFSLTRGLEMFDRIRSPHYTHLYETLDKRAELINERTKQLLRPDQEILAQIEEVSDERHEWMYYYKVRDGVPRCDGSEPTS